MYPNYSGMRPTSTMPMLNNAQMQSANPSVPQMMRMPLVNPGLPPQQQQQQPSPQLASQTNSQQQQQQQQILASANGLRMPVGAGGVASAASMMMQQQQQRQMVPPPQILYGVAPSPQPLGRLPNTVTAAAAVGISPLSTTPSGHPNIALPGGGSIVAPNLPPGMPITQQRTQQQQQQQISHHHHQQQQLQQQQQQLNRHLMNQQHQQQQQQHHQHHGHHQAVAAAAMQLHHQQSVAAQSQLMGVHPGGGGGAAGAAAPPLVQQHQANVHQQQQQQQIGNSAISMSNQHVGGTAASIASRKRKLVDRLLPSSVRDLVPESEAYMEMLDVEKKIDLMLMRKRLSLQECLKKPFKTARKLRVILSTAWQPALIGANGEIMHPAGWELRVEGRLLDQSTTASSSTSTGENKDASSTTQLGGNQQSSQLNSGASTASLSSANEPRVKRKFSSFFKSLVIELNRDLYGPDNHLVEWQRTPHTQETDGFQVRRPGEQNVKCTVLLALDHRPPQFKLDARLARLLGLHTQTRAQVMYALWTYIKTHRLQDPYERDFINCDQYLEQVFGGGVKRLKFAELPTRLTHLLHPPDPIVINHMIHIDPDEPRKTACFDIDIEMEDPFKGMAQNFLQNSSHTQEIARLDAKIFEIMDQINQVKTSHQFYEEFADDPQNFITRWLCSQSQDLRTMTENSGAAAGGGNAGGGGLSDAERKSDYYNGNWLQQGVTRYFYNRIQQHRRELENVLSIN